MVGVNNYGQTKYCARDAELKRVGVNGGSEGCENQNYMRPVKGVKGVKGTRGVLRRRTFATHRHRGCLWFTCWHGRTGYVISVTCPEALLRLYHAMIFSK